MNSYSARNASRGYFTLHHPELSPNIFQWVLGHELPVSHEYGGTQRSQGEQVYSHMGGAGGSRAELQNPLGDRNKSRQNVSDNGSCELSVRALMFALAQTGTGLDPNYGDSGEGNYWSEGRRDNRGASRMPFFFRFLLPVAQRVWRLRS